METHQIGEKLLAAQQQIFEEQGWIPRAALDCGFHDHRCPSSTKNAACAGDPEMHQTEERQSIVVRDEGPNRA